MYDDAITISFGKVYAINITQQEKACETLSQLLHSDDTLRKYCEDCVRGGHRPLGDLLIVPFQRACRYPLLFRELLKTTDEAHPDRARAESALSKFNSINTEINEFKRDQDHLLQTRDMEDAVEGSGKLMPSPTRRLVRHDDLISCFVNQKEMGEAHVLLFNDVLYYTKKSSGKQGDTYKLKVAMRRARGKKHC